MNQATQTATIRVVLPAHLRTLAGIGDELALSIDGPITQRTVLGAIETRHPVLRGAIRDHATHRRRALVRFYACRRDLSNDPPDAPLPAAVADGTEPFLIVGAMAGG